MAYTLTYTLNSDGNSYTLSGYSGDKPAGELAIPDSYDSKPVTSIGTSAFRDCYGLTRVVIPDSVTSIGTNAFRGCSGLTSIVIPDSVTSIGNETFRGCSGLTSVTIPDSVTSTGIGTFFDCSGLISITIPDSVTSIGLNVFRGCSGLTTVTIGNGVTSISGWAFSGCSGLTTLNMFPTTPPTIQDNTLDATVQNIYVPAQSGESYKTATNWNTYADKITEFPILDLGSLLMYNNKVKEKIASIITELENKIEELSNKLSHKQDILTFDLTPTEGSSNPVTSEGIKAYVDNAVTSAITDALNTAI